MIFCSEAFNTGISGTGLRQKRRGLFLWTGLWVLCALRFGLAVGYAENIPAKDGWSEDLLVRLLSAPETAGTPAQNSQNEGWVLRSYQLRTLHLGEPGRATNLVSILKRMLPSESKLTEDKGGNALHVFSTVAAQEACLEFISAMDGQDAISAVRPEAAVLPDEVRKALADLAASRSDSAVLQKILDDATHRLEDNVAKAVRDSQSDARTLQRSWWIGFAGLAAALVSTFIIFGIYFKRTQRKEILAASKSASSSLALVPAQGMEVVLAASRDQQDRAKELQKLMEGFSIAYQADRQRGAMIVEAVTRNHGELASTLDQMRHLRREIGESAGKMFLEINRDAIDQIVSRAADTLTSRAAEVGLIAESASRKMEETANRLEVQHAKAESLANELERTQKEVDSLFDKLKEAQDDARRAQEEAHGQRLIAAQKAAELSKKEAALAGLSLLMQEPVDEIMQTLKVAEENARESVSPKVPSSIGYPTQEDLPETENPRTSAPAIFSAAENSDEDSCSNPHPYHFHITPVS